MSLTPRSTILLAPALALALLQLWAFASGLGRAHLENALIGIVILKSNIPTHGAPAYPWIILPFLVLCIGIWETLETMRRPERAASWRVIFVNRGNIAKSVSRYFVGFGLAGAITMVFNFVITTSIPIFYLISKTLSGRVETVFTLALGILCPLLLGYAALLSYCHWIRNAPT